jgi:hypothetical protein
MDNKKRITRGGEKGKNNSVNFEKSKNEKFEILIIGFYLQYFIIINKMVNNQKRICQL